MPNSILYGPVNFAVAGAACGVSSAMLFYYDSTYDRVDLENSVPLAAGALFGAIVGFGMMHLHQRYPRCRPWIETSAITLLICSSVAVVGWLAGDHQYRNPWPGMTWGALAGLAACGVYRVVFLMRIGRSAGVDPSR